MPPFEVMSVLAAVARRRAAGRDVVNLCVGEPSQGAPAPVRAALVRALEQGVGLGYSAAFGLPELRQRLSHWYAERYGLDVDAHRIALTTGSSGAFLLAFLAAFDAGDRVALARPGYPAYRNILSSLGCEVVELDCGPAERYQPTPELLEAAGPLDGLVVASPANPTGTMLDADRMAALAAWCADAGVRLVSDEIYHGITDRDPSTPPGADPPAPGVSALASDPTAVVVSSFSKYWGMTGWRLGWAVLPDDLVAPVDALAGNYALCPPVPSMYAALAAFQPESLIEAEAAVAAHAEARRRMLARVGELGWGDVAPADGAFYVWADISPVLGRHPDSRAWCTALLEQHDVGLTPGLDFDPVAGGTHVRVSLAPGAHAVDRAVERILRFQTALAG
ncbi:pyridoxal phosphate-dependent aminotransferase [Desertihabitans brevis]|nr:aminotransferase class I/II-fold pyridoxal phosphate-dependent enzyme [Desertihabitans brevis]